MSAPTEVDEPKTKSHKKESSSKLGKRKRHEVQSGPINPEPETQADPESEANSSKKSRKDHPELEVDINAAEPPSRKAARKAKKQKLDKDSFKPSTTASTSSAPKISHAKVSGQDDSDSDSSSSSIKITTTHASKSTAPIPRSTHSIWIGNLSFNTTRDDLLRFLTTNSTSPVPEPSIRQIRLPSAPRKFNKFQNKGFGHVDFHSADALSAALKLSETLLGGRKVLIKDATNFEGRPVEHVTGVSVSREEKEAGKGVSRRVFVGNLPFDVDETALKRHFAVCGEVRTVKVATFEDSGKCKGFGWVEFEAVESAARAVRGFVELNNKAEGEDEGEGNGTEKAKGRRVWVNKLEGNKLRMEFAEDATTRYNKRYGKEAKRNGNVAGEGDDVVEGEVGEDKKDVKVQRPKKPTRTYGYEEETVNRMTGAITESKGQKVVFD